MLYKAVRKYLSEKVFMAPHPVLVSLHFHVFLYTLPCIFTFS